MKIRWKQLFLSLLVSIVFLCFGLSTEMYWRNVFALAALIFTIGLWMTDAVPKWISSIFLLFAFSMLGSAPIKKLFQFPLSQNFLLIVFSYLFSQGVKNSGLFEILLPVLQRYIKGRLTLLLSVNICAFIMIWIVPQPFARIVLLLQLYSSLFDVWGLNTNVRQILCFLVVNAMILLNCALLRGDIILNEALLTVSHLPLTELTWGQWMFIPTLLLCLVGTLLFDLVFRRELRQLHFFGDKKTTANKKPLNRKALLIIAGTIVLWLTEPITGISGVIVVIAACVGMTACGILHLQHLKCINFELLIFLTAAFSIGPAMTHSGIAQQLCELLLPALPKTFNLPFAFLLMVCSIALHMVLGSCVTAISIAIPALMILCQPPIPTYPVAFLAFLAIVTQYLVPAHNVSLMVGAGTANYTSEMVLKYGTALTICEIIMIPIIYLSYWNIAGLIS